MPPIASDTPSSGTPAAMASRFTSLRASCFHEAAEDMLNDYKANRKRTYVDAKRRIDKHLAPFFGNKRMSSITTSDIRAYIAKRLADTYLARAARRVKRRNGPWQELPEVRRPVSVGEINRELTVLKRMFSLAIEGGSCITSRTPLEPTISNGGRPQRT